MPLLSTYGSTGSQSFGNRGLRFGGSAFYNAGGDRLIIPLNTAAFSHTGNFTVEMYVYPTNLTGVRFLWRQAAQVYMFTNGAQIAWYHGTNPWQYSSIPMNLNQWNHVAAVRNSGTVTIYVNGTGSGVVFNNNTVVNNENILIGSGNNGNQFLGYITNVRVAKQALYTSNFTPSSVPLTRFSQGSTNTTLLLNMNSASTLNTDSGPNNFTVTNFSVTYSDFNPFSQPYVTPPNTVIQSATVTPSTFTPGEGDTITFTVSGTNTPNGTYYYTIEEDIASRAVTADDFTPAALSGSFTMTSNSGSFTLTVNKDLLTEGEEIFTVNVRKDSTSGFVLGTSGNIIITDTSITPAFTSAPSSVDEGTTTNYSVNNLGPAGTYFWTVQNVSTTNSDFSSVSGSFTTSTLNGTGTFSITTVNDYVTEGNKTFRLQIRTGSTSGTVILTSGDITLVDTSQTVTATASSAVVQEGNSIQITVSSASTPSGTYYWTILHGTTSPSDFFADSGSFTVNSNSGSFFIFPVDASFFEENETFQVQIRINSTSGPVIATTDVITVFDSSEIGNEN